MSYYEPPKWQQLQTFYLGLQANTKAMLDAASGGSINKKSINDAYKIKDEMASNNHSERSLPKKARMYQVDENTSLVAQIMTMQQQMNQLLNTINAPKVCELCR